ncbi:alpha/beta fold hydrolase [Candidatus Parcubacteria bacterium]|nr:MAG: alpha/beta fold hydrolase [Candidatus Parcubacteria bacterium]
MLRFLGRKKKEGFISVKGGRVWFQTIGSGPTLLVLHGGPGYPHDYLEPLKKLSNEFQVVFYDQLGCGNSERSTDMSLWTVEHFVSELENVIATLGLEQYHILGQSWGAALAVSFAQTKPRGLQKLILANPYISTPIWEQDAARLIEKLHPIHRHALKTSHVGLPQFDEAQKEYYRRFVYGMDTLPEPCVRSGQKMNGDIYRYMWGPTEFVVTGTLKNFDPSDHLKNIALPTLFICGRNDEATPEACEQFAALMSNALVAVLEKSAHHAHWTETEKYIQIVRGFLVRDIAKNE